MIINEREVQARGNYPIDSRYGTVPASTFKDGTAHLIGLSYTYKF
jgi:hypothetical protein